MNRNRPITLINLLNAPVWGVLTGCLLGALLVYGYSAIVYFTATIIHTQDPLLADLYQFVSVQNALNGVAMFLITWLLSGWLGRRIRPIWAQHFLLTGVLLVVFLVVSTVVYFGLGRAAIQALSAQDNAQANNDTPTYVYALGALAVGNLFLYVLRQGRQLTRRMSEQEYQLLNMEKLKNRAELDALQAKINPHFLYNALNSIASLVHEDAPKAEEMTMLLSKLFRHTTGRDGSYFCTLTEELEMVKTYLRIEQVRFGDRLHFTINVADAALNELQLPQFLLQPIVENAVKHGISKRADSGKIDVLIFERDGWLHLVVADNGPAFPDTMGGGYGLRSIQEKLTLLYGEDARVEFQNEPTKQVLILVKKEQLHREDATIYAKNAKEIISVNS